MKVESLRSAITRVSGAYLATAGVGTWLAVRDGLVGRPFGWDLGLGTLPGFLVGLGTGFFIGMLAEPITWEVAMSGTVTSLVAAVFLCLWQSLGTSCLVRSNCFAGASSSHVKKCTRAIGPWS
ncbi:MAG: hypothetical protein ACRDZM_09055 [Acidimicrobiia bacterium]